MALKCAQQERYRHPDYEAAQLEAWWKGVPKSLLTVGVKGVQATHANSLANLLQSHDHVRVKVASDRLNALHIAQELAMHELVATKGELLECRKKEFMFGSMNVAPKSPLRVSMEMLISQYLEDSSDARPELTQEVKDSCLALGKDAQVYDEMKAIQTAFKKQGQNFLM